jgi:hypothetical protein
MAKFFKDNGLTIVLMLLFLGSLVGQWLTGVRFENQQLTEHGEAPISAVAFLSDVTFLSTVVENWESEFLQMAMYVIWTAVLFQRGSAESKDPDAEPRDPALNRRARSPTAPSPLRARPTVRWIYAHSLGLALLLLFVISFTLHWYFSALQAAQEAAQHGEAAEPIWAYLASPQLWFESFQNWQSEFLSAAVLVVLSIWLRQTNSPESKAVTAPHNQTGT